MAERIAEGKFDVAIIGAGVVGCAAARRFALAGARVIVIEKGPDILSGASKANSAILHTGFDAPPESLEWQLVRAGREEYLAGIFCGALGRAHVAIRRATDGDEAPHARRAGTRQHSLQLVLEPENVKVNVRIYQLEIGLHGRDF